MRTRTRSTIVPTTVRYTETANGQVTWDQTTSEPSAGKDEVITDDSDPEWYKAQKEGRVLMRACSKKTLEREVLENTVNRAITRSSIDPPYTLFSDIRDTAVNVTAYTYIGDYMQCKLGVNSPTWNDRFRNVYPWGDPRESAGYKLKRLLEAAYADAGQSQALIPVSIAEFEKTRQSIGRLASLVPRCRKWIQRNEHVLLTRRSAFRLSGEMARQWLEYRFGFMQLYYDVKSLQKAWKRIGSRKTVYARREVVQGSIPVVQSTTTSYYDVDDVYIQKSRRDLLVAGVVCESVLPALDVIRALGLDKPLTTMWELTRLSWVVDRFINVSQTLGALEGAILRSIDGSWTSHRTEARGNYVFQRRGRSYCASNVAIRSNTLVRLHDSERIVQYDRVPNPPYPYLLPELRFNLSIAGATDLAALLRGMSKTLNTRLK